MDWALFTAVHSCHGTDGRLAQPCLQLLGALLQLVSTQTPPCISEGTKLSSWNLPQHLTCICPYWCCCVCLQFLPRKFKIAVTVPGDNSVDILTNDIGVVVITDPATGELQGFDLLVGGGMGRTHRCDRSLAKLSYVLEI